KLRPLLVRPDHLRWVCRIRDRFVGDVHPLRDWGEVENDGMSLRRFKKVDSHGIDRSKVPGRLPVLWRFQFGDSELRIGKPWNVTHVVRSEIMKSLERIVMHRRASLQRRIDHNLQRRGCLGCVDDLIPMRRHLDGLFLSRGQSAEYEKSDIRHYL